jgi:hypothetical protein
MMQPDHSGRFSLWAVLGIAAIVLTTTASATWFVSRAYVDDELAQYRSSEKWDLPQNLQRLGDLSAKLSLSLDERKELDSLRVEVRSLRDGTKEAAERLRHTAADLDAARKELASLKAETFEIAKGEAKFVVPGVLAIGLKDASTYLGQAEIQFGKETTTARPGTPFEATVEGTRYIVTLLHIRDSSCTFAVSKRSARTSR